MDKLQAYRYKKPTGGLGYRWKWFTFAGVSGIRLKE
jgi:hypothetical protein